MVRGRPREKKIVRERESVCEREREEERECECEREGFCTGLEDHGDERGDDGELARMRESVWESV